MRAKVALLGLVGLLLGCAQVPEYQTQATKASLVWGGQNRTYQVHVPNNLKPGAALVLALHGGGSNASQTVALTGFNTIADREGFVAVYPDGTANRLFPPLKTWNAIHCCSVAYEQSVDDVGFLAALIQKLTTQYSLDPKKVYVTGISNGAMMAYRLAAERSDLIAAIAPVSGTIGGDPDITDNDNAMKIIRAPGQPVALAIFHGTADRRVPYNGGQGEAMQVGTPARLDLSVAESTKFWVKANGCNSTPQTQNLPPAKLDLYSGCRAGTEVAVYSLNGYNHVWTWTQAIFPGSKSTTQMMWEFFAAHPKP